jgi:hypothetical protein
LCDILKSSEFMYDESARRSWVRFWVLTGRLFAGRPLRSLTLGGPQGRGQKAPASSLFARRLCGFFHQSQRSPMPLGANEAPRIYQIAG